MIIEDIPISAVKPYEKNPRKNDKAVDGVAESIKQFGFKQPIVIDKNGVIVAGHTRYKAALKLGLDTVPCVRADDLTQKQIKAYRILDNKLNELSSWDFETLGEELEKFEFDFEPFDVEIPTFEIENDFYEEKEEEAPPRLSGCSDSHEEYSSSNLEKVGPFKFNQQTLPEPLRNIDLTPDKIPQINGSEETLFERLIIVYKKSDAANLCAALGLKSIDKVLYKYDELFGDDKDSSI